MPPYKRLFPFLTAFLALAIAFVPVCAEYAETTIKYPGGSTYNTYTMGLGDGEEDIYCGANDLALGRLSDAEISKSSIRVFIYFNIICSRILRSKICCHGFRFGNPIGRSPNRR